MTKVRFAKNCYHYSYQVFPPILAAKNDNEMKNYISNSMDSVRMFKSGFFEKLSKVHFIVPLFIFIPVIFISCFASFKMSHLNITSQMGLFMGGLVFWTFTEYILHRFVFHFVPKSKLGLRLHFIMHGVHHDYPNDAKRLVMPPSLSIPLAALFYLLFKLTMPAGYCDAFFAGFMTGYLIYDMTHYVLHHYHFKSTLGKKLKKHHMIHHYADPRKAYGVSSPIWDMIFRSER